MWIATTRGFFSVVEHREKPDTLIVRARARKDLEALCEQQEWDQDSIQETASADYLYRINIPRKAWQNCLADLGDEIDYDNFKDAVKLGNPARAMTYMSAWAVFRRIEDEEREPEDGITMDDLRWLRGQQTLPWPGACDRCHGDGVISVNPSGDPQTETTEVCPACDGTGSDE